MSVYEGHGVTLHHADCLDVLRSLPDCSVDSVVCDPPYALGFMGREWDTFGMDVGRGAQARSQRRAEVTPTGEGHSTSAGPYLASGVDSLRAAGLPFQRWCEADATERPRVNGTAHPTVKPLSLMRWLVRLVTPPGGTVLEPFAGSGTTVEACIIEGFQCIAIEREADYLPLIRQRIDRRRDPVEALRGQAADLGLFDLLGGEGA